MLYKPKVNGIEENQARDKSQPLTCEQTRLASKVSVGDSESERHGEGPLVVLVDHSTEGRSNMKTEKVGK